MARDTIQAQDKQAARDADLFNMSHHVGTRVAFHPETIQGMPHSVRNTLSPAFVLGGMPAIWLTGWGTPVRLDHVKVI